MMFLITGIEGENSWYSTEIELVSRLERIVTLENYQKTKVKVFDNSHHWLGYYCFSASGTHLFLEDDCKKQILTPTINQKLNAELSNNSPQSVQPIKTNEKPQTQNYLLIKDNEIQEKSFDDIQKEVSRMSLVDIQKITLYNLADKVTYNFSTQKALFESKDGKTLSDELTKHLSCTYKMLIVSAEDPNNPFKLTKKYMCEQKVLLKPPFSDVSEYDEMNSYRINQSVINGGEFKVDGLFKGHLVRIFLIKNNTIIGGINHCGIFYKGRHKVPTGSGEFNKCQTAIQSYFDHLYEFRKKPLEEIKKIYTEISSLIVKVHSSELEKKMNNADEMVDIMIKVNELAMHINFYVSKNAC
jgi:hypothetical protein